MAASTYAVYLFHVPVLVALQYGLSHASLGPLIKFLVVTLLAVPITFAMGSALQRVPVVRSVL